MIPMAIRNISLVLIGSWIDWDTIVEDNGVADCGGGTTPLGDTATIYLHFEDGGNTYRFCLSDTLTRQVARSERILQSGQALAPRRRLLPKKFPISIARCGGTAWHLVGSHEAASHPGDAFTNFLTVVAQSGVPPPDQPSPVPPIGRQYSRITRFVRLLRDGLTVVEPCPAIRRVARCSKCRNSTTRRTVLDGRRRRTVTKPSPNFLGQIIEP